MNRIEFLTYPSNAPATASRLACIRIDGEDLRTHVAGAAHDLWVREREERREPGDLDSPDDPIANPHNGLPIDELADPVRHFLGDRAPEFDELPAGDVPVLGCSCGVWGCGALVAAIAAGPDTVTWSGFRGLYVPLSEALAMGPFVFERGSFEAALGAPVPLAEDPLGEP
ncbi:hypothetical protein [Streptomyces sp. NPDC051561]|uniref:hypothetical protein n=1 Tax=Streptomyces sp. NPDC051561 TaxID=3365658 RepID=UPI0037956054